MTFWNEEIKEQKGDYDTTVSVIPDDTRAPALIEDADFKQDEKTGLSRISLKWKVLDGDYEGRVVFQNLKIQDPLKSDKAKRMLAAINFNAGGKLTEIDNPGTLDLMENISNKPMIILIKTWDFEGKQGNWVCAVSPLVATKSDAKTKDF